MLVDSTNLYSPSCLEKLSEKSGSLRVEASDVDETSRKSAISLLGNPKMEAPGATLDPFQTVSRRGLLGNWASGILTHSQNPRGADGQREEPGVT